MSDLEVRVWRRYGNLRLYLARGEVKVGWYDVRTGAHEIETPADGALFWETVRSECARLGEEVKAAVPEPRRVDGDLAYNRAGAVAQARSVELRSWRTRIAGLFGVRTEARDFAFGAKGERAIGRRLDRWAGKRGWDVLHAVPVGRNGADIDHVLIGPFGVVTVNTKATRGTVWVAENGMMVSGTKVDYLRNSRFEAKRARSLLGRAHGRHVPVQPVIVFVGAKGFTVRGGGPKDVAVLKDVRALRRWLARRGTVLEPDQVAGVYEVARTPATWRT